MSMEGGGEAGAADGAGAVFAVTLLPQRIFRGRKKKKTLTLPSPARGRGEI
jgi:hypothetical protein